VQGLVDYYQPENPIEWHLVQQVAMAMVRQHRVWGVEAAITNQAMLSIEKAQKYPQDLGFNELLESLPGGQSPYRPKVLKKERRCLEYLLIDTENWVLMHLPKRHFSKWENSEEAKNSVQSLHAEVEEAIKKYPREAIPQDNDERLEFAWRQLITFSIETDTKNPCYQSLKWTTERMVSFCSERIAEIDSILEDMNRLEQEIHRTVIASKGISDQSEKLTRYERHITKQLHDALDRLQAIQQQRQQGGSMGSFGQSQGKW
jgi:DNA repair exonuclease SbcCD ATPase subunit